MKIAVIFTGGTIACSCEDSVAGGGVKQLGKSAAAYGIIESYRSTHGDDVEFVPFTPYEILSENLTAANWVILYGEIYGIIQSGDYNGIIVTHGTDTLTYTAAFLSACFPAPKFPLYLVSANTPLDDPASNGYARFNYAVACISANVNCDKFCLDINGIFVAAENVYNVDPRIGIGGICGCAVTQGVILSHRLACVEHLAQPHFALKDAPLSFRLDENGCMARKILLVKVYPGIDYGAFLLAEGTAAVLLELYHSGTAGAGVIEFVKKCVASGIGVYAVPFDDEVGYYATSEEMRGAGVVFLRNITLEYAYALLLLKYNADAEFMAGV